MCIFVNFSDPDGYTEIMEESAFVFRKCTLKYQWIMEHHVSFLSNGSGKICLYVCLCIHIGERASELKCGSKILTIRESAERTYRSSLY